MPEKPSVLLIGDMAGYGKFDILETTGFIRNALTVWDEFGVNYRIRPWQD